MTKKELPKAIAEEVGLPIEQVREVVQSTFDGITKSFVQEGRVELRNFGMLQVKERKPRKARNPRTGELLRVPRKFVAVFEPGLEMAERVARLQGIPGKVQPATAE